MDLSLCLIFFCNRARPSQCGVCHLSFQSHIPSPCCLSGVSACSLRMRSSLPKIAARLYAVGQIEAASTKRELELLSPTQGFREFSKSSPRFGMGYLYRTESKHSAELSELYVTSNGHGSMPKSLHFSLAK